MDANIVSPFFYSVSHDVPCAPTRRAGPDKPELISAFALLRHPFKTVVSLNMRRSKKSLGYDLGIAAMDGRINDVLKLLAVGADMEVKVPVMGMMMGALNAAAYANRVSVVCVVVSRNVRTMAAAVDQQTVQCVLLLSFGVEPPYHPALCTACCLWRCRNSSVVG